MTNNPAKSPLAACIFATTQMATGAVPKASTNFSPKTSPWCFCGVYLASNMFSAGSAAVDNKTEPVAATINGMPAQRQQRCQHEETADVNRL